MRISVIAVLLFCAGTIFAQSTDQFIRVKFENTASHTFTVTIPSKVSFDPGRSEWLNVQVGQEIFYKKMLKSKSLFTVLPEMHNTVIDVSSTAKLRNKGNETEIVYLRPPQELMYDQGSSDKEDIIYNDADILPSFPTGQDGLYHYITEHLNYPDNAKAEKISGTVVVDFIVDKDGEIVEAELACDIGAGCGEEALRLVNGMPKWYSGLINDEPVAARMKLPISFGNSQERIEESAQLQIGNDNSTDYWEILTSPYIRSFVSSHKKIAILPASTEIINRKNSKKKDKDLKEIQNRETELSNNFQEAFYKRLEKLQKKEKLNVAVQDIYETNKILASNDLNTLEQILLMSPQETAEMLNVDAVFYTDIQLIEVMSKGLSALIDFATDVNVDSDISNLEIELHDGCSGMSIWKFYQETGNSSLIWKTDKIIESVFKKEVDKKFPYHSKY